MVSAFVTLETPLDRGAEAGSSGGAGARARVGFLVVCHCLDRDQDRLFPGGEAPKSRESSQTPTTDAWTTSSTWVSAEFQGISAPLRDIH